MQKMRNRDVYKRQAMKGLGASVYDTIAAIYDGTFTGGTNVTLDAAQGGVSLAMDTAKFDTFTQEDYDLSLIHISSRALLFSCI